MRNRERNQGDRQKGTFEKVRSDSYMFFKKQDPISRVELGKNRISHENMLDLLKGIEQESKELETFN